MRINLLLLANHG